MGERVHLGDVFRMRFAACLVLLLAAGCGGGTPRQAGAPPRLPHALAQRWATEADGIAAALGQADGCRHAQQLAAALGNDVNAELGQIPKRFQAVLVNAVTTLTDRVDRMTCAPPKPKGKGPKEKHGHGPGKGPGKQGEGG